MVTNVKYFKNKVDEYITAGVAENVDEYLLFRCIEMLECMKEKQIEPDYLQVYRMRYDEMEKILTIRHSQEEPDYENEISLRLPAGIKAYEGKIYYIDDIDHRTFLLAEEY